VAYLVFLGVQALRAAWSQRGENPQAPPPATVFTRGVRSARLLCNLSNPKIAVFFTSFLPQFAPSARRSSTSSLSASCSA